MQKLRLVTLLSCVLALSGCSTYEGVIEDIKYMDWSGMMAPSANSENLIGSNCPAASVVPELGTLAEFADNAKPTASTLISFAKIDSIQSKCDYASQSVTVDLKLAFQGQLGPVGRTMNKDTFIYPFFVAVTSPGGAILAKEVFSAGIIFGGVDQSSYQETMRQIIPIPNKDAGKNFRILAGFQLTQQQLEYNRAVIATQESAQKERARIEEAQADARRKAAKLGASSNDEPEVVIVPDTISPSATPEPVEQQPLSGPINLAPAN